MIPVESMTEEEINSVAEAFADYSYEEKDKGLEFLIPNRNKIIEYVKVIVRLGLESNMVYTNSPTREGFIIITDTTKPISVISVLKMLKNMIKVLGLKNFINFTKKCQSGGISIETKLRKEKKQFIQVELLAIRKEFQGKGYMRSLINNAYELAAKKNLPCILTTDAKLKNDKYVHLGMNLVNIRKIDEDSCLYDLYKEF